MKKNFSQEVFIIAVLVLTITVVWLYLSVYSASKKGGTPILNSKQTQILNPKLDTDVFDELKKRIY